MTGLKAQRTYRDVASAATESPAKPQVRSHQSACNADSKVRRTLLSTRCRAVGSTTLSSTSSRAPLPLRFSGHATETPQAPNFAPAPLSLTRDRSRLHTRCLRAPARHGRCATRPRPVARKEHRGQALDARNCDDALAIKGARPGLLTGSGPAGLAEVICQHASRHPTLHIRQRQFRPKPCVLA